MQFSTIRAQTSAATNFIVSAPNSSLPLLPYTSKKSPNDLSPISTQLNDVLSYTQQMSGKEKNQNMRKCEKLIY